MSTTWKAARVGHKPEQIAGRIFFDLMPPELAITRRAAVRQVAATGEPMRMRDQRGAIFFDNSLYPVKDEYGVVESIAIYAKDVSEQRRAKQVEDIFHRIDTVLLKWRVNVESIAQMFCEEILPTFNLVAAWVGRAEKDGQLSLLASAEVAGHGVLDQLHGNPLRWDDDVSCCAPVATALRSGQRQVVALDAQNGRSCATPPRSAEMFSAAAQDAAAYRLAWQSIESGAVWRGDMINARPDGLRYTVTQTVTPLRNSGGQVSHYVAVIEDISERRENEKRMYHSANFDLLTDLPNRACCWDKRW